MMMNGLPAPPTPPTRPTIEQLQTISGSLINTPAPLAAPFLPFVPPQVNPALIQSDGPPLVNGPINYFYQYSDRLGTEKN
jgi:hypothetical protein